MTMLRIVSGTGTASISAIFHLSLRVAEAATGAGLRVISNKSSRSPRSASRYLTLRDAGMREWLLRISNHRMPLRSKASSLPHLDLVSLDGVSGLAETGAFIRTIAAGTAAWRDPSDASSRTEFLRARKRRR